MNDRRPKKRPAPISYRPPQGLSADFRARVQNSGLPVNAFITAAIFGQSAPRSSRRSPLDQKMVAMLLSQAARISSRLEQVVPPGSDTGQTVLLQECRDALTEIRGCLMQALGRDS